MIPSSTPRHTPAWILLIALIVPAVAARSDDLVIGSKKFTESYVLGEIARRALADAGVPATHKQGMGGTIILWQALKSGAISIYPEYTGTIGEEILKSSRTLTPAEIAAALAKDGIAMTPELGFNNTYALVMRDDRAAKLGIRAISDLRARPELAVGLTHEFIKRRDGWEPLSRRYALRMSSVKGVDHKLGYTALKSGSIDIKDAYSTDAEIAQFHLRTLKDDLRFFPQYKAVYLYRKAIPPQAVKALNKLAGTIDEPKMIALNAAAQESKDYTAAANQYFGSGPARAAPGQSTASRIAGLTLQHLSLVGQSLVIAILVGIPLGIVSGRPGLLSQLILGTVGVIQTIPSLALLALLVPIGFFGISARTAVFALFLYSLLPIVRNTAAGLQDIPKGLRDSAAALGLSPRAQLLSIFLPLASRTILAGIKTSAVINVGTATLAALIGAGGLGEPIISGLNLSDNATILQGAIPAAGLAVAVQFFFDLLDRILIPKGLRLPAAHP